MDLQYLGNIMTIKTKHIINMIVPVQVQSKYQKKQKGLE